MSTSGLRRLSRVVVAALCSLSAFAASAQDEACTDAPRVVADLKSAWTAAGTSVDAARKATSAPVITHGRRVTVRLQPEGEVALRAPGRRTAGYAGIFDFTLPSAGIYRVMSSERAWIEVLSPAGQPLPVYMRPLRCLRGEGVQKELIYRLDAGQRYTLEMSAVAAPGLDLLIIAEPTP
ncbi:MAG: hypothetical protein JZU45_02170 [Methyloversatilis discipulorum]|uniref:hypothetical protein n=1 Tax=Methyloversatilis discipulorum TaxID=1119528 RepID=UPI0026EEEA27|nr:hypothetical protein [Methyloversatilis discipulorum]MBV5284859.1 hypothetical protein [Methyloversatilis discipulorum]